MKRKGKTPPRAAPSRSATSFERRTFELLHDRDSGATFEGLVFDRCVFDNCSLSRTLAPGRRSTVQHVRLQDCTMLSCHVGPAVFRDVTVDGLKTNDLLLMFGPVFERVTLVGGIASLKVNSAPEIDAPTEVEEAFARARGAFYEAVDWALDISQARLRELELSGVPARLVRRDPETQVVVTRERALKRGWRRRLSNEHWRFVIEMFLEDGEPDVVLAAPRAKPKKVFLERLAGLEELRRLGVAEPD